jgi:hypothetical protein
LSSKLQAKFDFSKASRKWQDQFSDSAEVVARIMSDVERPLRRKRIDEDDQAYDDYVQAFYDTRRDSAKMIREQGDIQSNLISVVLVDVPREWLLADAPEKIDWSKPESLDYIQVNHYLDILEQVRNGEARKLAKN